MDAAREDACFYRRAVAAGANDVRAVDVTVQTREKPSPFGIGPDQAAETRAAAERGDVVRGVPGAAADHLRGVVLQDEHGRLARDARDLPVNEFVGDDVADDEDAAAGES